MASILKPTAPRPPATHLPYSAAVQQPPPQPAQAAPAPPPPKQKPVPPQPAIPIPPPSSVEVPSSPSMTHPSAASPMSSYASVSHERDSSFYESPALSEAIPGPVATSSPQRVSASRKGVFIIIIPSVRAYNLFLPADSISSVPRVLSPLSSISVSTFF